MTDAIVATLNIPFSQEDGIGDDAGKNKIVLQQMTQKFDGSGQLWARCFPSRNVRFVASVGTVLPGEVRSQQVNESLKFSNSSKAQLKLPGATNVSLDASILMKKQKDVYGHTRIVPTTSVTLVYDADQEAVVAFDRGIETAIYGACFVQYQALYQMLYYKPFIQRIPVGGADYAVNFNMGTIFGYNDYTVEILDMELDVSSSINWTEYARVTSKIVLDARGTWEYPPNWEGTYTSNREKTPDQRTDYATGTFPGTSYEIDPENSFTDIRIHCIVEVNTLGSLRHVDHTNGGAGYWAWFDPYYASSFWNPVYEIKFADPPGGAKANSANEFQQELSNNTWRDVFLSVDKTEVIERLQVDYPGAIER